MNKKKWVLAGLAISALIVILIIAINLNKQSDPTSEATTEPATEPTSQSTTKSETETTPGEVQEVLFNTTFDTALSTQQPDGQGKTNTDDTFVFHLNSGGEGTAVIENGMVKVTPTKIDVEPYAIQLIKAPISLERGKSYQVQFDAKAEAPRDLQIIFGSNADLTWTKYSDKTIKLSTEMKTYTYEFTMKAQSDKATRLEIWLTSSTKSVWLDNIILGILGEEALDALVEEPVFINPQIETPITVAEIGENALVDYDLTAETPMTFAIESGDSYNLTFDASATTAKDIEVLIENSANSTLNYFKQPLTLSSEIKTYSYKLSTDSETDPLAQLVFQTGDTKEGITIENVSLTKDVGQLLWQDEFDYEGLPDPKVWGYDVGGGGWGNQELEYYTKDRLENAQVKDGNLIITAIKEDYQGMKYTSARLITKNRKDFLYGRVEVRAMLPQGVGTWPAIWTLPTDWSYGGWPDSGEVDIMEHVGYDMNNVHASTHSLKHYWKTNTQITNTLMLEDVVNTYHTYSMEWTPGRIEMFIDDQLYFVSIDDGTGWESWPFDQKFHLLLNIAVGGAWGGAKGMDDSIWPQKMTVDYVRFYDMGYEQPE